MERIIEMTTNDGRKYQFVEWEIFGNKTVSTYHEMDGRFVHISKSFKSLKEAEAWIKELNKPIKQNPITFPNDLSDYYGCGRYCGD